MVSVISGTDTYGAVRKVGSTPIVTRFAMLQMIPMFPLESYYLARLGKESMTGIPLVMLQTTRSIIGLRLARVDRLSVAMAYVRAVAAVALVFGFLGVVGAMMPSFGAPRNPNDAFQRNLLPVSLALLATSLLIALPSYLATYVVRDREKRIRGICAELLGIAVDPAKVDKATAEELSHVANDALMQAGITEPEKLIHIPGQARIVQAPLLLMTCRILLAKRGDRDTLERATDALLQLIGR